MQAKKRHTIAVIVVLLFGFALFYIGTDGFTAYTAETARVNKLMAEKPQFPNVTFEDSNKRQYSMDEFAGKYVLATFIYTSCTTVCIDLEMNMSEVYDLLPKQMIGKDIQFLSISFDPEKDDPETLDTYKTMFPNADGDQWRMTRIQDPNELKQLLDEFGVIVIPDEYGNYAHNSAFYLIDPEGTLIEVMDYTKIEEAAQKIVQIVGDEKGDSL
ncbi:SCO family protein [Sporosarcina sp. HYO08]|uniref:SCO family protein n=1 Tax=Sporosarcina sp. HYO08 TaxID=1759557 RepID=UPI00079A78EB|nr:SCO family protein [Sporosarcina sp. HYO08]KXH87069.1 electron transporter SenC [Sporosarcina sp. HYO08]